ncbi:hypothetical protein PoB_001089100 [Plakobranchus ocellatus]|uniref:Uncharacterized protein n=1 Tax=Plakobranchus ocellatus TaxID=259542 RepID=A0AAV3YPP9_9GAST|nr:hypothetical protein PoB_001089100 [Plakobranchus ocellatus]
MSLMRASHSLALALRQKKKIEQLAIQSGVGKTCLTSKAKKISNKNTADAEWFGENTVEVLSLYLACVDLFVEAQQTIFGKILESPSLLTGNTHTKPLNNSEPQITNKLCSQIGRDLVLLI